MTSLANIQPKKTKVKILYLNWYFSGKSVIRHKILADLQNGKHLNTPEGKKI